MVVDKLADRFSDGLFKVRFEFHRLEIDVDAEDDIGDERREDGKFILKL